MPSSDCCAKAGLSSPTARGRRIVRRGTPDYVPPAERVAVFDSDSTLWVEQPFYTLFALPLSA